jgi:hypothetical protein
MVSYIMVNGRIVRNMGMESCYGLMGATMREVFRTMKHQDLEG